MEALGSPQWHRAPATLSPQVHTRLLDQRRGHVSLWLGGRSSDAGSLRERAAEQRDHDLATLHFNCARAALKEGRHLTALEQAGHALQIRAEYANTTPPLASCTHAE